MNVLNFSLATLVRLFRNIKNIKNYTFHLYASDSLELRGIYLLVAANSPQDVTIDERFKACFFLSSYIDINIQSSDILVRLDEPILEVLLTMSLKEADICSLHVREEEGYYHIYANDVERITTVPKEEIPEEYVRLFPTIGDSLSKEDFNVVELPLQRVLDIISTMPFDCHSLAVQILNDYVSISVVNENHTRLVLFTEPIDYPCDPDKVYAFSISNLKYLHDICGHLPLNHSVPFFSDSLTNTSIYTYLLNAEYTSFALRKKEAYSDVVVVDMGTMTFETHDKSQYETYRQVMEGYNPPDYKFSLNPKYINSLYKKSQSSSVNRIEFLDISGESYIDCRDISWLNRLAKKYGDLQMEVSGGYTNVVKTTLPDLGDIYFTIYRKAKEHEYKSN